MRVPRHVAALLTACLTLLAAPRALRAQTPTLTLGIEGDHFTVDTGQGAKPKFLLFVSYFDGLRASNRDGDLDYIASSLGTTGSVQAGIRVFPNWAHWGPNSSDCSLADDSVFDSSGTIRTNRLNALRALLSAARARGLIVDITFSRESIVGSTSVPSYITGVKAVAAALTDYRNVLFDLQNERDKSGAQSLSSDDAATLRGGIHDLDPDRIVVASDSGDSTPGEAVTLAGSGTGGATLHAVAYHDSRGASNANTWYSAESGLVTSLRAAGKPVYMQEPWPWNSGLSVCGQMEPTDKEADGTADHFRTAVANARNAGAAAWTFHTRQSFRLDVTGSLKGQIQANGAERALFEGGSGNPSLATKADSAQWPITVPVQVTVSGTGHGVVGSTPTGIQCGTDSGGVTSTACATAFPYGATVTLMATPANDSLFTGWSGGCTGTDSCVVTLAQTLNVSAEFTANAGPTTDTVQYMQTDVIGSVRAITNAQGQTLARHDFLPFGEVWSAPATLTPLGFAGKERDGETSLNYFGARYYSGGMGRFTTVDPGHVNGSTSDPQGWNGYAYARNNPLRYVDADGRFYEICAYSGESTVCGTVSDQYFSQLFRNPGAGISLSDGSIYADVNGERLLAGSYRQVSVDPTFNDMIRQIGNRAAPVTDPRNIAAFYGASAVIGGTGAFGAAAFAGSESGLISLGISRLAPTAPAIAAAIKFTETAGKHMEEAGRYVPIHLMAEIIAKGPPMADPAGEAGAARVVGQIFMHGAMRTVEIVYRVADYEILHFQIVKK